MKYLSKILVVATMVFFIGNVVAQTSSGNQTGTINVKGTYVKHNPVDWEDGKGTQMTIVCICEPTICYTLNPVNNGGGNSGLNDDCSGSAINTVFSQGDTVTIRLANGTVIAHGLFQSHSSQGTGSNPLEREHTIGIAKIE